MQMKARLIPLMMFLVFADMAWGQVSFSPVPLAFPQIAVGGASDSLNYITLIQIVNNNSASTTGKISLYSDSGSALAVLFDGQGPQSTLDFTLAPGATRQIQLTMNGVVTAGWMLINYTPSDALTS